MKLTISSDDSLANLMTAQSVLAVMISAAGGVDLPADPTPTPSIQQPADSTPSIQQPAATGGAIDSAGTPWDERIHASSKQQTAKGIWKRRRGVDDNTFNAVMAELSGTPSADPNPNSEIDSTQLGLGQAQGTQQPADPAAGNAGNVSTEVTWEDVFQRFMAAKVAQKVTQEQGDSTAMNLGVATGFVGLMARPDLWQQFLIELSL